LEVQVCLYSNKELEKMIENVNEEEHPILTEYSKIAKKYEKYPDDEKSRYIVVL
jgi:mRNA-degrading endonuclease HigB of HigAB toxin-antitoxin module